MKFSREIPTVMELKARALQARQVLIRTEAAQTCYTSVDECLIAGHAPRAWRSGDRGSRWRGNRRGDRPASDALPGGRPGCGRRSTQRADRVSTVCGCVRTSAGTAERKTYIPTSEMSDGKRFFSPTGAMAELTITNEEYAVPVSPLFLRLNWPC